MRLNIDGFGFESFEMKYTLLELGFAYFLQSADIGGTEYRTWLGLHSESIPGEADRQAIGPCGGDLITSDPVLFTLAYRHWWHQNGEPMSLPIRFPTEKEAIRVQRERRILNAFNERYKGKLPGEWIADLRLGYDAR